MNKLAEAYIDGLIAGTDLLGTAVGLTGADRSWGAIAFRYGCVNHDYVPPNEEQRLNGIPFRQEHRHNPSNYSYLDDIDLELKPKARGGLEKLVLGAGLTTGASLNIGSLLLGLLPLKVAAAILQPVIIGTNLLAYTDRMTKRSLRKIDESAVKRYETMSEKEIQTDLDKYRPSYKKYVLTMSARKVLASRQPVQLDLFK